jgi:hypothetical protein
MSAPVSKIGPVVPVSTELLQDSLLSFQAFTGPQVSVRITPDPLGPVNKILTLMVDGRPIRSVLHPVGVGTVVRVEHESGGYGLGELFALQSRSWGGRGWRSLNGEPEPPEPELPPRRQPGWYIEVDGRVVLYATEAEVRRPVTVMIGRGSWRSRVTGARRAARLAIRRRTRALADRIAKPFGYHHEDDCTGWDE